MTAQENTNNPTEPDAASGAAFDQGDIDSLFESDAPQVEAQAQGAESAQGATPGTDEPASAGSAVDQSDIDALFDSGHAPEPAAGDAGETGTSAVNQSDIDSMFSSDSSEGATEEVSTVSEPEEDARLDSLGRPFDAAAAEMAAAIAEEKESAAAGAAPEPPPGQSDSVSLEDFGAHDQVSIDPKRVTMLSDVKLRVRVELGRSRMLVEDVLQLNEGSVVELQKAAGDPVDIIVNERLIARGEVLVLNDNFCVRINEIVATDPHRVTI